MSLKQIIKKNQTLYKIAKYLYDCYQTSIFNHQDHIQFQIRRREKCCRKKFGISHKVSDSFLDSRTFWVLYNVTQNIVKKNSPDDWIFVDVGASNGWYTHLMQKLSPSSSFIMFEPLPKHNNHVHKKKENTLFFPLALGKEEGTIKFLENLSCDGLSSMYPINTDYKHFHANYDNQKIKEITIPVKTMDRVFLENDLLRDKSNIFLKMDCQGGEFDVLKGSKDLLSDKIKVVHMEIQLVNKYNLDYHYTELYNFMLKNGFVLFDINPTYKEKNCVPDLFGYEGQLTELEIVFIKKELSLIPEKLF